MLKINAFKNELTSCKSNPEFQKIQSSNNAFKLALLYFNALLTIICQTYYSNFRICLKFLDATTWMQNLTPISPIFPVDHTSKLKIDKTHRVKSLTDRWQQSQIHEGYRILLDGHSTARRQSGWSWMLYH